MKSAQPLDRHDIENLTTRSARAWVRVRATVEENERLREANAELLAALEAIDADYEDGDRIAFVKAAIDKARSASLEQVSR